MHRFGRPSGVKYTLTVEEKLRNYVIGHTELGLDLTPVLQHFSEHLSPDQVMAVTKQALGKPWIGTSEVNLSQLRAECLFLQSGNKQLVVSYA